MSEQQANVDLTVSDWTPTDLIWADNRAKSFCPVGITEFHFAALEIVTTSFFPSFCLAAIAELSLECTRARIL